uniref:Uncharacterized protein n=1 Tax=Nelumbo nucifera TaxID=4432 RepID=A0A822XMT2_NELNU|nr:TPA_asm: hypothetical protein HUJ06_024377 [Nelumbo nucifera]
MKKWACGKSVQRWEKRVHPFAWMLHTKLLRNEEYLVIPDHEDRHRVPPLIEYPLQTRPSLGLWLPFRNNPSISLNGRTKEPNESFYFVLAFSISYVITNLQMETGNDRPWTIFVLTAIISGEKMTHETS